LIERTEPRTVERTTAQIVSGFIPKSYFLKKPYEH